MLHENKGINKRERERDREKDTYRQRGRHRFQEVAQERDNGESSSQDCRALADSDASNYVGEHLASKRDLFKKERLGHQGTYEQRTELIIWEAGSGYT